MKSEGSPAGINPHSFSAAEKLTPIEAIAIEVNISKIAASLHAFPFFILNDDASVESVGFHLGEAPACVLKNGVPLHPRLIFELFSKSAVYREGTSDGDLLFQQISDVQTSGEEVRFSAQTETQIQEVTLQYRGQIDIRTFSKGREAA